MSGKARKEAERERRGPVRNTSLRDDLSKANDHNGMVRCKYPGCMRWVPGNDKVGLCTECADFAKKVLWVQQNIKLGEPTRTPGGIYLPGGPKL